MLLHITSCNFFKEKSNNFSCKKISTNCENFFRKSNFEFTLHYQIRVQHQIRVQADHFEILNKNTASNNTTGNQILKFPAITHLLRDRKCQFFVKKK